MKGLLWKRTSSDYEHILLWSCIYFLTLMMHPHTIWDVGLWIWSIEQGRRSLSSLGKSTSRKNFKFWFDCPQNSFPNCLSPIIFGQEKMADFLGHVHTWLLLFIFEDGTVNCVYRQLFLGVSPSLWIDLYDRIVPVSSLLWQRTFFWSHSTMMCIDTINLQVDEPLPIFTSDKLCLSKMVFLYRTMILTCCLLTKLDAKCSLSCFFLAPLTFPVFGCTHPNFWDVFLPSNPKWVVFHEIVKCLTHILTVHTYWHKRKILKGPILSKHGRFT